MQRFVSALGLLLLLCACGGRDEPSDAVAQLADLGVDPQAQHTVVADARYTPPAGTWHVRSDSLAPGQWYEEYARKDAGMLLRVTVFPIRGARTPAVVVGLAIDTFLRSLGADGFGSGERRAFPVWGAPAAQSTWTAMVGGGRVLGEARLLRVSDEHWAFAVGVAPEGSPKQSTAIVRGFVSSLEPGHPVFYARRFAGGSDFELVVARAPGEVPVTLADVAAVELVLEAGVGTRFPLSTRPAMRGALREHAAEKDAQTRASFREVRGALDKSLGMAPDERVAGMRALGSRALQGLLTRATRGYAPARKIAAIWRRLREVVIGTPDNGLTVGDVRCLHEHAAFLASLATNREVRADVEREPAIAAELKRRWSGLATSDKRALRQAGVAWARLRKAWDEASVAQRTEVRSLVAAALAPAEQREPVAALPGPRELMQWMDAIGAEALDGFVLRAAALEPAELAALVAPLAAATGTDGSTGWDLGW